EHDHRQQQDFGDHAIERIFNRRRIGKHARTLAEIIEEQQRKHETQPSGLNRLSAEMAEIGIKRLAAGDGEEDQAERDQPDVTMGIEKIDAVERIDRPQYAPLPDEELRPPPPPL